jgi:hypothetical protein
MGVKARCDEYALGSHLKEETVREAPEARSPSIGFNSGKLTWILRNATDLPVYLCLKRVSEPSPATVVPINRLEDFKRCAGRDGDSECHPLRARTSSFNASQLTASASSASAVAARRTNSSRWAGVIGASSSERLSQSSSMSFSRSAGLSLVISSCVIPRQHSGFTRISQFYEAEGKALSLPSSRLRREPRLRPGRRLQPALRSSSWFLLQPCGPQPWRR